MASLISQKRNAIQYDKIQYDKKYDKKAPVEMLGSCQRELFPPKERAYGSNMVFDPRPCNKRSPGPHALEGLRCNLLNISQPVGLLNINKVITKEDIVHRLKLTKNERNK